jgi:molybdopterin converting factor small subunit
MSVEVNLPPSLQPLAGGVKKVNAGGRTIKECLDALVKLYPDLQGKFYNKNEELSKGLNIFINGESAYPGELGKPVRNGDKVHIAYVMLGG